VVPALPRDAGLDREAHFSWRRAGVGGGDPREPRPRDAHVDASRGEQRAHYARTLRAWRDRFHARIDEVRALGFDERFIRMWDLYLAYCEAAFLERHAGDFQLVLTKNNSARTLFNEVRAERETGASAVP